jgi:hypothetical protein
MCVSVSVTYSMYYSDSLSQPISLTRACSLPPSPSPIPQSLTRNLLRVNRNKPHTLVPVVPLLSRRSMTATALSEFCASSRCRLPLSPYYSLGSLRRRLHTSYPSHSPLHRYREMVEMTWRRVHGNGDGAVKAKSPTGAVGECEHHDHGLSNTQPHTHSQSHGVLRGHSSNSWS